MVRIMCRLREQTSWSEPDDSWMMVRAGDTEPFSFGQRRGRRRGRAGGAAAGQNAALNQLALRLDGWSPPDPVCVDRVGVFFRNLTHTVSHSYQVSFIVSKAKYFIIFVCIVEIRRRGSHSV